MRVRSVLATAVLTLVLPPAAAAQGFEYAPGAAQYKVTQTTKAAQEMMGQKQEGQTNAMQLFTLTLTRPSKDTVLASYVIDSVYATTAMGTTQPFLDRYKGMKVEVRANPTGTNVFSVKGPTEAEVPNSGTVVLSLGGFLPRMRGTIARGATWTDTVSGKINQSGIELDRKVISRIEVLKDTTIGGASAWKLQRNDSTTLAGTGNSASGPMSMEGTVKGSSTFFMTPKGALLGASGTDNSSLRVVLAANGMEIIVTTSVETKVEKVR